MSDRRLKVAVLVNTLAPSRIPVYAALAAQFQLLVLHGGKESNRDSWTNLEKSLPGARVLKAWGWQVPFKRRQKGQVFDNLYLHVTPGYIWHLLKFRPEALITNEMGLRTMIALAYGTFFRKPVWVWWGGTCHTESKIGALKQFTRRFVSAWASRWISYGQSSTEYLQTLGIDRGRILQIQNAVDEKPFLTVAQPERTHRPRVQPQLLCVGQLIARKGIDLLLNAAAVVQNRGREFSLLFVGSGPDKQILQDRVKALNLKNVIFHSSVPQNEISSVYRNADALIFPTLEDPWGLVVNEAILSGLPVLCSRYAGCAEELLSATNIFDPHNPGEFAEKLEQAIDGHLAPPDRSLLKSISEVSDDLVRDLKRITTKPSQRKPQASVEAPIQR
jgi:glycosyltransferase involved in cell wall biosynthesis